MTGGRASYDFSGRVTLVTGGSRGIGFATAQAFARAGARVAITGRGEEDLETAAARIGSACLPIQADAGNPGDVQRVAAETLSALGRVDVLVNNAGIGLHTPAEDTSEADWRRILDVSLTGAFQLSQSVGTEMLRAGGGSIVNVGSLTTFLGFPGRAAYGSSKAAIAELTRVLASEWGPRGIRVNCVAPGWIASSAMRRLIDQGTLDPEPMRSRAPLRRMGEPEDVADAILFLASDAARFITGATLPVDGGWLAYGYF